MECILWIARQIDAAISECKPISRIKPHFVAQLNRCDRRCMSEQYHDPRYGSIDGRSQGVEARVINVLVPRVT
jgi:hypothetical protein